MGETSEEDAKKVYELEAALQEKQVQLEELKEENKNLREQLTQLATSADGSLFF